MENKIIVKKENMAFKIDKIYCCDKIIL